MPHIIIEHPEINFTEIDLVNLSSTLHNYLATHETIEKAAIKTRTIKVENIFVGENTTDNVFIHITILLLTGRSQELKELITKNIYTKAKEFIPENYAISVEARELGTYYKG